MKKLADESAKTRKAREKLKKQWDMFEKKITPKALEEKTIEIHRWIERHAPDRVVLRAKTISLFDENQNAAKLSTSVLRLVNQMRRDVQETFSKINS